MKKTEWAKRSVVGRAGRLFPVVFKRKYNLWFVTSGGTRNALGALCYY